MGDLAVQAGVGGAVGNVVTVLRDRCLLVAGAAWTIGGLLAFGLVSAIIPNPIFGRLVPAEPFAIGIWIASAPLMGLIAATYTAPLRATGSAIPPSVAWSPGPAPAEGSDLAPADAGAPSADEDRGSLLGTVGSLGAFLAIGCPVCNKLALLALGTSGALTIWAPVQPYLGAASLALLAGTLAWRLRIRARGGACAV